MSSSNHPPSDEDLWLVQHEPGGHPISTSSAMYDPLRVEGLHRRLADVRPTLDDIRAFCDLYGLPGRETRGIGLEDDTVRDACPWTYLVYAATKVQALVRLWDLTNAPFTEREVRKMCEEREVPRQALDAGGDLKWTTFVAQRLGAPPPEWEEPTVEVTLEGHTRRTFAHYNAAFELQPYAGLVNRGPYGGLFTQRFIRHFVISEINRELKDGTHLGLAFAAPESKEGPKASFKDLVGAVYIHFATEVGGGVTVLRRCPACQEWFVPKHGRQRFCEDRCKSRQRRMDIKRREVENGNQA